MHVVERFMVVVVLLVAGVLIFVSARRSPEQRTPAPATDSNDRQVASSVTTIRDGQSAETCAMFRRESFL